MWRDRGASGEHVGDVLGLSEPAKGEDLRACLERVIRTGDAAESFERVMRLYNELRGVFIVSGARLNPDGSQDADSSRVYSGFTDRHRLASYLKEGDPIVEMARLYRQSALVSVAVDLWLEER
ncbi:MAG: hypothetical protein QF415_10860 [Candidatus Undinarchaeales archaeon]|nr:hypothetical protein [Candidatus Undinarchaeales archaeon]MDP7494312.1 hypothetical protein [Candidatus Undinarchaeales archaeon]